jgi:hypothetical protein
MQDIHKYIQEDSVMKALMKRSPKGINFFRAEVVSVTKGQYGQWVVTVLLDETQYESMQYYCYLKQEARAVAERAYGINA